jgi:hypothetical protein
MPERRQRIHDLVVALLAGRNDLELLEADGGGATRPWCARRSLWMP